MSTLKDTFIGGFLMPHSLNLRNFPQREVKSRDTCQAFRSDQFQISHHQMIEDTEAIFSKFEEKRVGT